MLRLLPALDPPSCHGLSDGSVLLGAAGGTGPYDFQWENGLAGAFADGLAAGMYPLIISDSEGCSKPDTLVVGHPDSLVAFITYDGAPALCDESGHLTAHVSGGVLPYTYSWNDGADSPDRAGLGAGSYHLTATDANGCWVTGSYTIAGGDTLLVVQTGSVCAGDGFDWNGNLYFTDTLACHVFARPGGCDSTACLLLSVNPSPVADIFQDGSFCHHDTVTLTVAPGNPLYHWSEGSTALSISVVAPGTYSVTVTNSYGCTSTSSVQLPAGVDFGWASEAPTCFGDSDGYILFTDMVNGKPPWRFSVDGGSVFSSSPVFDNLPSGTYPLLLEDAGGCFKTALAVLPQPLPVVLATGEDMTIVIGQTVVLSAQTNLVNPLVLWQPSDYLDCPNCLTAHASPLKNIRYEATVTDANGCTATDGLTISVERQVRIYIPSAFSPNGDGINDRLVVYANPAVETVASFRVFDRWGGLVYEGRNLQPNDPLAGWDGSIKG